MANNCAFLIAALALSAASMQGAAPADPCSLLPADAIRRTTGEAVAASKPSSATTGKLRQSQCFYALPTSANSISVTLTGPAGAKRDAAREVWERWFHGVEGDRDADRRDPEPEEKEVAQAVPIAGVGDEAFWVHSFVGNLYVRKGNQFLRISLGGKLSDEERQARAKALAAAALRQLK
jgi:hypothetical protein